ncbi:MAG: hypothetical protein ACXIUV_00870 [Alkalilacustris sp.]
MPFLLEKSAATYLIGLRAKERIHADQVDFICPETGCQTGATTGASRADARKSNCCDKTKT